MGISLTEVAKSLATQIAVRREDVTRAKPFVLKDPYPATAGIADRWLKDQQMEAPTSINYMSDDIQDVLSRIARSYSLRMSLYQAVWELINSGEVVPIGVGELWKPHLEYRTSHGMGGIPLGDISYPYMPQIHRLVRPNDVSTDTDIFLRGVDCKTLHEGIREAIDQSLGCFRRGLYLPATAMLAAAAEATWTECGSKVAVKLANTKLDGVVNDPYASISKKVTEIRKALDGADGRALLKVADRTPADVTNVELWTTVLRERRNALHWDKAKCFVTDHAGTASLLLGAPIHIGTLEAVRAAC